MGLQTEDKVKENPNFKKDSPFLVRPAWAVAWR
jgi:hypothetical protein